MVWAALGKAAMGGLKAGAKKVATNKLLNRKCSIEGFAFKGNAVCSTCWNGHYQECKSGWFEKNNGCIKFTRSFFGISG